MGIDGTTVADGFAAKAVGTDVVDGAATEADRAAVVDVKATEASGTAVAHDATAEANEIQEVAAVVDGAATEADRAAVVDVKADGAGVVVASAEASGTAVAHGATAEANEIQEVAAVVNGAAPEANGAAVVVVSAEASETADATAKAIGIQRRLNLLKSFQVGTLKVLMLLLLSGVTKLVNNSNVNIEFHTSTKYLWSLKFCLNARQTKRINMRKLFAFRGVHVAQVVRLKVGGKYVVLTFTPQDFVHYKKLSFYQNDAGELDCPESDRVVRYPRHASLSTC